MDFECLNRKHAGCFLARDTPGFVKQSHHPLCQPLRGLSSCKGHGERRFVWHPRDGLTAESADLVNGPCSVFSMQADTERFGEWRKRCFQPCGGVLTEMTYKRRECGLLGVRSPFFFSIRLTPHARSLASASFGLPPR